MRFFGTIENVVNGFNGMINGVLIPSEVSRARWVGSVDM